MTEPGGDPHGAGRPAQPHDDLARNLACGLWAALTAVLVLGVIVAVAVFGIGFP